MKQLLGYYLVGVSGAFFLERWIPNIGLFYLIGVELSTFAISLIVSHRFLKRKADAIFNFRWPVSLLVATIATFCAGFVTLFNPLRVRPSPIPWSEGELDVASNFLGGGIMIVGLVLLYQSRRKGQTAIRGKCSSQI